MTPSLPIADIGRPACANPQELRTGTRRTAIAIPTIDVGILPWIRMAQGIDSLKGPRYTAQPVEIITMRHIDKKWNFESLLCGSLPGAGRIDHQDVTPHSQNTKAFCSEPCSRAQIEKKTASVTQKKYVPISGP
jgi:hypothetical protein